MQILTKNWHKIDPLNIDSYIRTGGYEALQKAIREMKPAEAIDEVKKSGLRGRGGAGFPTGEKWELAAKTPAKEKYFICNLDESEPGAYKDRIIAEKNPHQIIEGLLIGAFAVGAKKAFIYINGHYQKQDEILKIALEQAREKEFVGRSVIGSAVDIEIDIFQGAGAYICGEETALINSIEGKRGEPRLKPPYPPVAGLFGKPTIVNNAETLANVSYIIKRGAKVFSEIGAAVSPGTKLFVLEGAVKNRGIHEAPLGTTAQELVYNSLYGGGLEDGKEFWFAQIGGASGRLMPVGKLDQPLVYGKCEYPLGCGSIFVADKNADLKDLLFSWADFFHRESCGKCVPCREGTYRLWEIAKRLKSDDLLERDRKNIEDILWTLSNTTFCPLGNFASVAWSDAIKMFPDKIFNDQ
ncbi:MAG: NADH-ubiquinone oxidoreductase-F iron-sulfur binding region domain-containing protein [Candidatus Moranbacteria bacterium]|nr:NADH-ubiquinone oxidoreductase-F iron-sulfur binding region domain-containing protein [Candidatus Moranbacteria bacterium]